MTIPDNNDKAVMINGCPWKLMTGGKLEAKNTGNWW